MRGFESMGFLVSRVRGTWLREYGVHNFEGTGVQVWGTKFLTTRCLLISYHTPSCFPKPTWFCITEVKKMNRSSPVGRAGKSLWVSKLSGVEIPILISQVVSIIFMQLCVCAFRFRVVCSLYKIYGESNGIAPFCWCQNAMRLFAGSALYCELVADPWIHINGINSV